MATPGATARWVTAAAVGALIAAGLAITVVLLTPSSAWPLVAPVLAAPLLVVGGAMLRRPEVGVVAVMLIAFEYGISLVHRAEGVDSAAPLIGLGLLAMAELAHVAREWRLPHVLAWRSEAHRWAWFGAVAAAGVAVGALALAVTVNLPGFGFPALVAGAAAVIALLATVALMTRPAPGS